MSSGSIVAEFQAGKSTVRVTRSARSVGLRWNRGRKAPTFPYTNLLHVQTESRNDWRDGRILSSCPFRVKLRPWRTRARGPLVPVNGHRQLGAARPTCAEHPTSEEISFSIADPPLCPDPHTATKTCLIVSFRTDRSIPLYFDRLPVQRSDSFGS